jgi:hypothetical protein
VKYLQLPEYVFKLNLNALQLLIYADVHTMGQQRMTYFRSNKQIADMFQRDTRNVQRAIKSLLKLGLLEAGELNGMRTLTTKTPPVAKMSRGGGKNVAKGAAKMSFDGDKNATQVKKLSKSLSKSPVEKAGMDGEEVVLPFSEPEFLEAWEAWKTYKREQFGWVYKSKQAEQLTLVKLKNDTKDANRARQAIGEAMANGWKSIQPPKARSGYKGTDDEYCPERDLEAFTRPNF